MKIPSLLITALVLAFTSCQPSGSPPASENTGKLRSPVELYGPLLEAVQMNRIFPDGKTFVDCVPKFPPAEVLKKYEQEKTKPGFDLKAFVEANFDPPKQHASGFKSDSTKTAAQHINALWDVLTRKPDEHTAGTLIPLPHPYIVPGGRFGEVYYWDSYFTMLGLQAAGKSDMIGNMLDNFAYLIDKIGFIPNGNRTYYLGRSQPPYFACMVGVLAEMNGDSVFQKYLPQLEKEYAFWMEGMDGLSTEKPTHRRVVLLTDGFVLNRYWDDHPGPRPESYREDVETAQRSGRPIEEMYRHLRAGAESGWDFSSRWLADGRTLETIRTTDILPVDLNALLYNLERTIAQTYQFAGNAEKAGFYTQRASRRLDAVQRFLWNKDAGTFLDYDFRKGEPTMIPSLAMVSPLFFKMATNEQAQSVSRYIRREFLKAGGVTSTPNNTGQQWDAPNGWAPLHWLTIQGMTNYGETQLADDIKKKWVDLNVNVYKRTGKMVEKYNVYDITLEAGGGEYPVQDGFGWTNGVLLRLMENWRTLD
jgi:alpha,alpha-trehalase